MADEYQQPIEQVLGTLASDARNGLTSREALAKCQRADMLRNFISNGDDMATKTPKTKRKTKTKTKTTKKPARTSKLKNATRKGPTARKQVTQPAIEQVSEQCRQACPMNFGSGGSHRGVCYLNLGHSTTHKCNVDGFEWS